MFTKNFLKTFEANYIIISTEWSLLDVEVREGSNSIFKDNNKKIIITSNSPRFFFNIKTPFTLLDIKLKNIDIKILINKKLKIRKTSL